MKNILLIGGSSGIGYELSMKLENDHKVFVSTRNPDKFSGSNITAQKLDLDEDYNTDCLLYTSPSPRDRTRSRMPSSA